MILSPKDTELYLPFAEGSGTTAYDYSGNANNGTITGATYTKIQDGEYALNFNGSSDYVDIPSFNPTGNSGTTLSIFGWFKGSSQTSQAGLITQYDYSAGDRAWAILDPNADGKLSFRISETGVNIDKRYLTNDVILDGDWHHIGFTWNSGTLKIYIDGSEYTNLTKTTDNSFTTIGTLASDINLGHYASSTTSYLFVGQMRLPIIISEAKSADWIKEYYKATFIQ